MGERKPKKNLTRDEIRAELIQQYEDLGKEEEEEADNVERDIYYGDE